MEKIKQYYTDIVCLSFDKEGALEVTPLYDEKSSGSVLIKAVQNVDRENLLGQSLGGYVEAGQLQGPKDFKVIFGLPVSTSDTISLGDPYEDMTNYWVQVVLVYFDLFDGLIQTYVFVFLTSLFMKETIGDEEE